MSKYDDPPACGQPTINDPYKKQPCCQRRITVRDIEVNPPKWDMLAAPANAQPRRRTSYFPSADLSYPQSTRVTGIKLYNPYMNSSYRDPVTGDVLSREQWERLGRFDVTSTQQARMRGVSDNDESPRRRLHRV